MRHFILLISLLFICQLSFVLSAKALLPPLTVELGEAVSIDSSVLKQKRNLLVRLPKDYATSQKKYPVLYLLNASDFSVGNIFQESVILINRLENNKDMPEVILVGIQSENWYQETIESSALFEQYVQQEVPQFIDSNFRTLDNKVIVGHSYAAAMLSSSAAQKENYFDFYLAISPIYPELAFVENTLSRYQSIKSESLKSKNNLTIIQGDEDPFYVDLLIKTAEKLNKNSFKISYQMFPDENHQSVFSTGLNQALRQYFEDYRTPDRESLKRIDYSIDSLKEYYQERSKKYDIIEDKTITNDDYENAITSLAQDYSSLNKVDLALLFWQESNSRFKFYFMNEIVDTLSKKGEHQPAIKVMETIVEMAKEKSDPKLLDYQQKLHRIKK